LITGPNATSATQLKEHHAQPHCLRCEILFLLTFIVSVSLGALAQSQANSGNIEGHIADPNGAVVAGATVTATNEQTGLQKSTTTKDDGTFSIILLPPGVYTVVVSAPGFSSAEVKDVTVTVGSQRRFDCGFVSWKHNRDGHDH
jgi:hypothetical protein